MDEAADTEDKEYIFSRILLERGYKLGDNVGRGSYACVYKAFSIKYRQDFVVKISDFSGTKAQKIDEATQSEVDALCQLDHPNIISIYDHFCYETYYFIILEYCEGGSLYDFIIRGGVIPYKELCIMFKQIIQALIYCHSLSIAHSDIKPSNILVDKHGRPKLADFGLSQKFRIGENTSTFCGSKPYMAPELWSRKAYNPKLADIWSLGCTIFLLATGRLPWTTANELQMERMIKAGVVLFPQEMPPPLIAVLKKMLVVDPTRRESLDSLIKMPLFVGEESQVKKKRTLKKMISYDGATFQKLQPEKSQIRSFVQIRASPTFLNIEV